MANNDNNTPELGDVYFGVVDEAKEIPHPLPDIADYGDDDEDLPATPDLIEILGFDPDVEWAIDMSVFVKRRGAATTPALLATSPWRPSAD